MSLVRVPCFFKKEGIPAISPPLLTLLVDRLLVERQKEERSCQYGVSAR